MRFPSFSNELKYMNGGYSFVAGCDEVGVSPLAGPVVACACLLDPRSIGKYRSKNKWYYRVRDSKTTNEIEREVLVGQILKNTLAYGVGEVWQEEIDKLNIHKASLKAMRLATEELLAKIAQFEIKSHKILLFVDGRFKVPEPESCGIELDQKSVLKGDSSILSISAASIIAKVHRDNIMKEQDSKFPQYSFARHKGYNTKEHQNAILKHGVTELHRRSFFKKGWLREVPGIKK
ncbi:MAG TPA: ribonuclease HII [Candidatus Paceibacterota bacterium]|nr:ribonuclease HII [Candidatus Paceibacterota bacterium]